jgi:hypothetical protein
MDFERCIDFTISLTHTLHRYKLDINVINIILKYTLKRYIDLSKCVDDVIRRKYGACDVCNIADPNMNFSCKDRCCKCSECKCEDCLNIHVINNITMCTKNFEKFKNHNCDVGISAIAKCYICKRVICKRCNSTDNKDAACFECHLSFKDTVMSCLKCRQICLVKQYIPEIGDTTKYHPWFDEHIRTHDANTNHITSLT